MRHSVLIVDDSTDDRYILKRYIKKTGLDVLCFECENGLEALEFLNDHEANNDKYGDDFPPSVCFLDINMPRLDGWEFLAEFSELRKAVDNHTMAVMMLSSASDVVQQEKARSYDFVSSYIVKGEATVDEIEKAILSAASN